MPAQKPPPGRAVKGSWLPRLRMTATGDDAVKESIQELSVRIQKDIIRQAVRSAMGPILTQAKKNVKAVTKGSTQSTDNLYNELAIKVKQHRSKPHLVYGLVGAKRGKVRTFHLHITWRDKQGREHTRDVVVKRRASSYLHLLEKGFIHHITKRFVPGRFPLRNAIEAKKGESLRRFGETLKRLLPRHVAKARAKGQSRTRTRKLTK